MAKFPLIDSPCPLSFEDLPAIGNFHCQQCGKHVHDLSQMSNSQRERFLRDCTGDICVSYTLKQRVLTTAKIGSLITAGTIAAATALPATAQLNDIEDEFVEMILVGGVKDAKNAPVIEGDEIIDEQIELEEIPVIFIDEDDH